MALFRRTRDHRQQLDELERLVAREFEAQGIPGEIVRDPDDPTNSHYVTGSQGWFGLRNIVLWCLKAPEKQWRRMIREHITALTSADDAPTVDLDDEHARAALRARLFPEQLVEVDGMEYVRPFAPGLVEALCLDLPSTVQTLKREQLAGVDLDAAFDLGRRNLAQEEPEDVGMAGTDLRFAGGSSLFIASRVLDHAFVARHIRPAERGYVFGVPDRHLVFWHVVTGPESVTAVNSLVELMRQLPAEERPGGLLSREVYFARAGEVQRITEGTVDGGVAVRAEGAFLEALQD
ncbi:hypothetical protein CLV46_0943 [Diaminobutyricimonas aerilata]|uniref:Uncharacterized protein n=1 Tax=Diaminobutyricimonas aerilata TaxID=1162967 RepID=A0A2M9CHN2_9MICO|nr:hypothetical protein [Diaminobutyricimonas aerilata]PJJ71397.1 hypothetical protein CLV46_0943 [Diaminobutyricimonas aerilata]